MDNSRNGSITHWDVTGTLPLMHRMLLPSTSTLHLSCGEQRQKPFCPSQHPVIEAGVQLQLPHGTPCFPPARCGTQLTLCWATRDRETEKASSFSLPQEWINFIYLTQKQWQSQHKHRDKIAWWRKREYEGVWDAVVSSSGCPTAAGTDIQTELKATLHATQLW